jgi:imidazole glycerol-phosphate synthase subunit HisH
MIAVIDYGAGNLRSAVRALEHIGADLRIATSAADLQGASGVVLPGVGATADTMRALQEQQLVEPIRQTVASGLPFLGICVGMQVLADSSEEFGPHPCLGIVEGVVRRFPEGLKVPQIGWNQVEHNEHWLFQGIPQGAEFYFVHSYYVDTPREALVTGRTEYGLRFPSALAFGNAAAVQFHPEKSGRWGLKLLENFLDFVKKEQDDARYLITL